MSTKAEEPADEPAGALLFGSVAEEYERYRMGYSDELVDVVLAYAESPVRSALEVGAGTGQATRPFGSRDVRITALEPDAGMASVLSRTTHGLPVQIVPSSFERFASAERFDLLYAAAAWHWTDPRTRWLQALELLVPGGVIALFGRPCELADSRLAAVVDDIEHDYLPPASQHVGHQWSIQDLAELPGFADPVERELPGAVVVTADAFVRRLATTSAYLRLAPTACRRLTGRILDALPDQVEVDTTTQLVMARRE